MTQFLISVMRATEGIGVTKIRGSGGEVGAEVRVELKDTHVL